MDGILLVDKPKGWTSFDVVNKVRFMLADYLGQPAKKLKVGHSGTLDPMATGLLIVLVGQYTKRQAEFMKQDKTYLAEITLGGVSDTDDAEGSVVASSAEPVSKDSVTRILKRQIGSINQLPPAYSAIKLSGKKAYELARSGKVPELKPRKVEIYDITDVEFAWPKLRFRTRVSSGTYVRSMARDIGAELKTGGYLSQLRRESSGDYQVNAAASMSELSPDTLAERLIQA